MGNDRPLFHFDSGLAEHSTITIWLILFIYLFVVILISVKSSSYTRALTFWAWFFLNGHSTALLSLFIAYVCTDYCLNMAIAAYNHDVSTTWI
jgi:hypothetical protein